MAGKYLWLGAVAKAVSERHPYLQLGTPICGVCLHQIGKAVHSKAIQDLLGEIPGAYRRISRHHPTDSTGYHSLLPRDFPSQFEPYQSPDKMILSNVKLLLYIFYRTFRFLRVWRYAMVRAARKQRRNSRFQQGIPGGLNGYYYLLINDEYMIGYHIDWQTFPVRTNPYRTTVRYGFFSDFGLPTAMPFLFQEEPIFPSYTFRSGISCL